MSIIRHYMRCISSASSSDVTSQDTLCWTLNTVHLAQHKLTFTRQLLVMSRPGRTEHQLLLMKIFDRDRNVKRLYFGGVKWTVSYLFIFLCLFLIQKVDIPNPSNNSCPPHFSWAHCSLSDLSSLPYYPSNSFVADHVVLRLYLFHFTTELIVNPITFSEYVSYMYHLFDS